MYCRFVDLRIILRAAAGLTFSDALQEKKCKYIFLALRHTIGYRRIFGQNFVASYWSGKQALASHWQVKFANSTPAYLIICKSYAAWY
jgi:hypothetical protein